MMVYVMKGCESLPLLLLVKIKYNNCRVQHGAQFSSHWHHPAMLLLLPRSSSTAASWSSLPRSLPAVLAGGAMQPLGKHYCVIGLGFRFTT